MFKVGIYAASMGEQAFGVAKTYLTYINNLGGVPRILTPDNLYESDIDILLLQGGLDVNPTTYGQMPAYYTSNTDVFKQHVMDACLPNYIRERKPVFGICLGLQQIAATFGSALTQHLPAHPYSEPRWKKAHDTHAENAQGFYRGKAKFDTNSMHHQGIVRQDLGEELIPLAHSHHEEYGGDVVNMQIIEALMHRDLPLAGVQWHPEEMWTDFANDLFHHTLNRQ